MIELINDDYAQFVNLSSSLVNLQTTLVKLHDDFEQVQPPPRQLPTRAGVNRL